MNHSNLDEGRGRHAVHRLERTLALWHDEVKAALGTHAFAQVARDLVLSSRELGDHLAKADWTVARFDRSATRTPKGFPKYAGSIAALDSAAPGLFKRFVQFRRQMQALEI